MDVIRLNELLPLDKKVTTIYTGSELLLAYELDKYAQTLLKKKLVLSDVTISEELLIGEHFSFVVTNGLDVGFKPIGTLKPYSDRNFFTKSVEGVYFKKDTDDEVVFELQSDIMANQVLNASSKKSAGYISLIAYIMVRSAKVNKPIPKLIIDHGAVYPDGFEYVDLYILMRFGNSLLDGLVEIRYLEESSTDKIQLDKFYNEAADGPSEIKEHQFDWIAFVMQFRQRGWMNRFYNKAGKFQYLTSEFEKGDVVLLYERIGATESNPGKLSECYPAVIEGFDEDSISLTYYPRVKTRLTEEIEIEAINSIPEELRVAQKIPTYVREKGNRTLISHRDDKIMRYDQETYFFGKTVKFNLNDFGVERYTYNENNFLQQLFETDGSYQFIPTNEGDKLAFFSTIDTVYHVFEDYNVEYNKDRFLEKYYYSKNRKPGYSIRLLDPKEG
ncbi:MULTISPECIES: hypothetical protein [Paenibacillus]|uniref:hypothetical protein n=1 Tax=Paenibacillus TaxID=44249 RepID=UPI0011A1AA96|nr:hypothetical protein [Paenibacillus sp. IHBB 10380]